MSLRPITAYSPTFRKLSPQDPVVNRSTSPFLGLNAQEVIKQLRSTPLPFGYKTLVQAPKALPGTGNENLSGAFLEVAKKGSQEVKETQAIVDFFEDGSLSVIPDMVTPTNPRQIHLIEAKKCIELYHSIAQNKTSLRIQGPDAFQAKIYAIIKKLMACPSGRLLIQSLTVADERIRVFPDEESSVKKMQQDPGIDVGINLDEVVHSVCVDDAGKIIFHKTPDYIIVAHEWNHVLHQNWWRNLPSQQDLDFLGDHILSPSPSPLFPNLEEQFTVAGLKGTRLLCENMIRCELGIPARYSHSESLFPPYDISQVERLNEVAHGFNRTENACYHGALGEVRKLLRAGADPVQGYMKAAATGQTRVLRYFLEKTNLDPLCRDEIKDTAIHIAALEQRIDSLEFFKSTGIRLHVLNDDLATPLHYAALHGNVEVMGLLIRGGVPIDALDDDGDTALSIVCRETHIDAARLLLRRGAKVSGEILAAVKENGSSEGRALFRLLRKYYTFQNPPAQMDVVQETPKKRGVSGGDSESTASASTTTHRDESPSRHTHKKPRRAPPASHTKTSPIPALRK